MRKILCQQCNCQGAYGAGLSGAIASRYPVVRTRYKEFYAKHGSDKMFGKTLSKSGISHCMRDLVSYYDSLKISEKQ